MLKFDDQNSDSPGGSRAASELLSKLQSEGKSCSLSIDGECELVVSDSVSYQKLLDVVDRLEAIAGVQQGLDEMNTGKGIPVDQAFEQIKRQHEVSD